MTKIIMLLFCCLTLMSCGPSKDKMVELAKKNLTLNIDKPQQLKIIATSEPDSAFGTGYFSKAEVQGILRTLQTVTDTIMKRTDNMQRFNPEDSYVMSLAERQMRGMAEIRSLVMKAGKKGPFSGWKVKIDYASVDGNGNPYRAERWFFIDPEGKQVYKTFELPLP